MNDFHALIKDILDTKQFQSMRNYDHHGGVSAYRHSLTVAYMAYRYHTKKNPKYPLDEFVRGALLHDYYLYDWHHKGEGHRLHGFRHPTFAYLNAKRDFKVTKMMKDMILHHMFPLILIPPHTKAGWVLTIIDKKAARYDYKRLKHKR